MHVSHRLATATAAVLLLTGGLAGCALPGSDSGSSSTEEPVGGSAGEAVKGGRPGFDQAAKPVTKGTFDSPIAPGAKIDIAIMGIKVRGKLATLSTQYTPHIPPGGEDNPNPYELNGRNGLGTSLIDPVNLKRYVVVKDSSGDEMETDDIFTHIANNQTGTFSYTFAAPPENVEAVDVQIGAWPTFRNIPIER
ncbi:hypothetical protein E1281_15015 [Actinomadura sp. KC345]|uniref:hypothetical protein n=1 Tax=Actinomadura sp. KC345 TaxID=2530371 RepID=UPI00105155CD|nr:hypothetical protein [Actinomadura sp. KC345]TDC54935.1 hypothetical protein E1281_15015 [Actinomadura sp. KC345]